MTLLTHVWWAYPAANPTPFDQLYRTLNLVEGTLWCVLAVVVIWRFFRHRNSGLEVVYALAFVTFGVSDFREAVSLPTWLILAKGINLLVLFALRAHIIRTYYPTSRLV